MLSPRKTKFRNSFVRYVKGVAYDGNEVFYGDIGLISLENCFLTPNQIESARRVVSNTTKRSGKLWIRVFPDQPRTAKSANVRMGSGKGPLKDYVAAVKAGRVIFEIGGIDLSLAELALRKASKKLGIKTKVIYKDRVV